MSDKEIVSVYTERTGPEPGPFDCLIDLAFLGVLTPNTHSATVVTNDGVATTAGGLSAELAIEEATRRALM